MPLDKPFVRNCPLLLDQDMLSLAPWCSTKDSRLYDKVIGAAHVLHWPGDKLVAVLQKGVTYGELTTYAQAHQVSMAALSELLGFLNKIGCLHRKRTVGTWRQAFHIHCSSLLLGVRYAPLSWRNRASFLSICIGTLRATTPVILAVGVVAALSWVAGFSSLHTALLTSWGCLAIFIAGIVAHEGAHTYVLRRAGLGTDVIQSGMHLGIIHPKATIRREILSSLIGPLVGAFACGIAALSAHLLQIQLVSLAGIVISSFHIVSLLPLYGDGASLKKALHDRRQTL